MKWDSLFQNQSTLLLSAHGKTFSSHFHCLIYIFSSPDFNALDLGAWYSLAAGVPSLKSIPNQRQRTIDRIISHVLARWSSWDVFTRLENIFSTKQRVLQAVLASGGSNEYQIPRSGLSHRHEKPSYLPISEPQTPPLLIDSDSSDCEEVFSDQQSTPPLVIEGPAEGEPSFGQENDVLNFWRRHISEFE